MKKLLSLIIAFLLIFGTAACSDSSDGWLDPRAPGGGTPEQGTGDNPDETTEIYNWNDTIVNANQTANVVKGNYTDAERSGFKISNGNSSLIYSLKTENNKQIKGLYSSDGKAYFENTSAVCADDDGKTFTTAKSSLNGRMNCHRLGYYFYDYRFCDQGFTYEGEEAYHDVLGYSSDWTVNDVASISDANEGLSFEVSSNSDPYIRRYTDFSAQEYDAVKITLKTQTSSVAQLFITAGGRTEFSGEQCVEFTFNAGEWTTAIIPLSQLTDYTGTITNFRIDCGSFAGEIIQIKELKAINSFDIIGNSSNWAGNDVANVTAKNDGLSYVVTSSADPHIQRSTNFSADEYDTIQITIKTEYSKEADFYFTAGTHTSFTGEQHVNFTVTAGEWTTALIPLAQLTDYTGTVTNFRIDCGSKSGEKIQIRELRAIKKCQMTLPLSIERTFNTYPDKTYDVTHVVTTGNFTLNGKIYTKTIIPVNTVDKVLAKNARNEMSTFSGFDFSSAEYVAFDVSGVGIYGIIMPYEENGFIDVKINDGNYVITRGIEVNGEIRRGDDAFFGNRIYTSTSHSFDDFKTKAYEERHPLSNITVTGGDSAVYTKYDTLTGCYVFNVDGTVFDRAYANPDKQYKLSAKINGDGIADRTIYILVANSGADHVGEGHIECGAVLDKDNNLLPIPVQVSKNFCGEYEEPLFDPNDNPYSEIYFPITVEKDEEKQFTALHLYQNWGNYPLKQLSSVAYFAPYYHLSVGVTETNCIAPYFVMGKDGWVLPDFRANSAILWDSQPQHSSAGRLYFLQYTDADGNTYISEQQYAEVSSSGPIYSDITLNYLSDDGKIKATYRHAEMAQTDENRTYYQMKIEALEQISFNDFKNDFSFFTFDGRSVPYQKIGYLDASGNSVIENVNYEHDRIITLGKDFPYYDYFETGTNYYDTNPAKLVNFGLIVKSCYINGVKYEGNFVVRDRFDGSLNYGSLSLNFGNFTLNKGDVIELEFILMPWDSDTGDDVNVKNVRLDSCVAPYKITVINGDAYDDSIIPSVRALNNTAKFKISGGKNTVAIRVYGFDNYDLPQISIKPTNGTEITKLSGINGYDGYMVYLDDDGTYSFSFNVNMDLSDEYEITLQQ